jgi:F-type H+-transporting ATPase subunit delta
MTGKITAYRYAKALYETAEANGLMDSITEDIRVIKKILNEIPEIKKYCYEKHTEKNDELELVKTAFIPNISKITGNLLLEAVKNGRLSSVPLLPAAFGDISDQAAGRINVTVVTASEPDKLLINKITEKMEKRTGKKIIITKIINPEILGGFRIIWQNKFLDMSAKGRLRDMRSQIAPVF